MSNVCVFLAEGFEEIEAVTVIDLLKRAEINVEIISVTGNTVVKGAHNIGIVTDSLFNAGTYSNCDMMFLPGGMPGTTNLMKNEEFRDEIFRFVKSRKRLSAICAAPAVYGNLGILEGKKATCYPGFESYLKGAKIVEDKVVTDDIFTTSKSVGTAIDMALEMIFVLEGRSKASEVSKAIMYKTC